MRDLRKGIRDYLMLRRGLGFKLVKHEAGLEKFASFLERKRGAHITSELALEWATLPAHHQPCQWTARLTIVRGFARYWSAVDPTTEVPPLGLLPYRPTRARPYFYSDQEIQQLLNAAKARPSCDPLRPWTYHSFFGLLAVTGLRLSEAVNLHAEDLDWSGGILTIRGAKFGKSRLVPLHASTCKVLADYAKRRDRRFGPRAETHFFVNKNGNRLDKARSIGCSTSCLDRLDCVPRVAVAAHACTIFVTDLPLRLCCAGIETAKFPSGACRSCLPTLGTHTSPTLIGI